ncbi:MAG TPA: hypothetical protein VMA34_02305 [Terracidiphilus sp.]|nr:hypothetical protein [Terracidiphilus sp.]
MQRPCHSSLRTCADGAAAILLAAFFALCPMSTKLRAQSSGELKIAYTGRLFGYYRIEPNETGPYLGPVESFLKHRQVPAASEHDGSDLSDALLVGMGDNFAPEFGASIEQEFPGSGCESRAADPGSVNDLAARPAFAPESLYKSELRLPAMADCDNVVRFLVTAGYRAIVPGREDFIYSATWLRRVALLLRGASDPADFPSNPFVARDPAQPDRCNDQIAAKNCPWKAEAFRSPDGKLHILAANLRVKVSKTSCPLLFSSDLASPAHPCNQDDGTITDEMNWVNRLDQSLDPGIAASLSRQGRADPAFHEQLIENEQTILKALLPAAPDDPNQAIYLKVVQCIAASSTPSGSAGKEPACSEIKLDNGSGELYDVARELLAALQMKPDSTGSLPDVLLSEKARKEARELFLELIYREQKDVGYTVATTPDKRRVLIIGVVGQETMQEISATNFRAFPDVTDCLAPNVDGQNEICLAKKGKKKPFAIKVGDPRPAAEAILRAAWAHRKDGDNGFDSVMVMAQMPGAEALELGARIREDINRTDAALRPADRPSIDLILSEAQEGHETPDMEIGAGDGAAAPVLSPADASRHVFQADPNPVSIATLSERHMKRFEYVARVLENRLLAQNPPNLPPDGDCASNKWTAACLLKNEVDSAAKAIPSGGSPALAQIGNLDETWNRCGQETDCENAVLMQYLLRQLQRSSGADVVLLKSRDFYFGQLGSPGDLRSGYGGYEVCDGWLAGHPQIASGSSAALARAYCRLHVALDRVLWKGDYSDRVMVDGATLTKLLKTAQGQADDELTLLARDMHQEWLTSYGIVTSPPTNLAAAAAGTRTFTVPGVPGCTSTGGGSGGATTPYCMNGQAIVPDRAYWVATSDELADDKVIYTDLGSIEEQDPHAAVQVFNRREKRTGSGPAQAAHDRLYLTTEIADEVLPSGETSAVSAAASPAKHPAAAASGSAENEMAATELRHENRRILQVDFSKVVAGYTLTRPSLSDSTLGNDYAGVSNTQALTPHSQEFDFETAGRLTSAPVLRHGVLGVQTDAEYDRKVTGNVINYPETVVYAPNSFTAGGFAQWQLHGWGSKRSPQPLGEGIQRSTRNLPRAFLVIAPYQFQRQVTGTFLSFPYFTPPNTSNPQELLTVHLATAMGFSQRAGVRLENAAGKKFWQLDAGSYAEIGPEFAVQNGVLSAVRFPDLPQLQPCQVSAAQSLPTCVKNAFKGAGLPLNGSTVIVPETETLHAGGFYWTAHLEKGFGQQKNISGSFDTGGDDFLLPGVTLTTQTRYAFTTKLAINFKVAGNMSFSPTYSDFFFENQGISSQRTGLVTNTFLVAARWYFARDAVVPWRRQLWYSGPASEDQTSSARIK